MTFHTVTQVTPSPPTSAYYGLSTILTNTFPTTLITAILLMQLHHIYATLYKGWKQYLIPEIAMFKMCH